MNSRNCNFSGDAFLCLSNNTIIVILTLVSCNIVGYVIYLVISLPVIWHISFVLGTFCLYDFVERKYFSAEQSYRCRQCNFMA